MILNIKKFKVLKYLSEKSKDKAKFQFSRWPPKEIKMLNENKNTQ